MITAMLADWQPRDESDHPWLWIFEGPTRHVYACSDQRLVRKQMPSGEVRHYKGPKGSERLVRQTRGCKLDNWERRFKGPPGRERMVSAIESDIDSWTVEYYTGPPGQERKACTFNRVSNDLSFFEGPSGCERIVRAVDLRGRISYYEGDLLRERCVRQVDPDGHMYEYEGDERDGGAWLERHTHPSGQVDHHHSEYGIIERTVWPDGTIDHFQFCYASRTHRVLVTEHPNGQVRYYSTPFFDRGWWLPKRLPACWCEGGVSIWLRDGRILRRRTLRWVQVRRWVAARAIALHWQERTQMRLAAPGGAGRAADLEAFESDFAA